MTKKEAIYILRNAAWLGSDADRQKVEEAVEVVAKAIEALEGNGVAQERKYTFGNDEFNLEYAYHDCKLVFDGITDDDSFQEADTGLILYYANEIIYALHEALKGKDTNVPNTDTISRQATITEIKNYERDSTAPIDYVKIVEQMPPAQPDARYINANELIKRLQQAGLDDAVSIAVKMAGHERLKHVPSAQPDLIAKIQNGINTTNANDSYSCGMRNGMRWCMSLVDGKEPLFENCPSAQPERKKGKWIPVTKIYKVTEDQFPKTHIEWVDATEPDEIDAVRCSECGEVFDFQDARNWCTECGTDMR